MFFRSWGSYMQNKEIYYDICNNTDIGKVVCLALKLWDDADYDDLKEEFEAIVNTQNNIVFTACFQKDMIAFAHCAIRNEYVEGADSNNVGYLEAVYVEEKFRNLGIASHLIELCEIWAKSKDCKQFASDCELNNLSSINLHRKNGFSESAKLIHFIKYIGS